MFKNEQGLLLYTPVMGRGGYRICRRGTMASAEREPRMGVLGWSPQQGPGAVAGGESGGP